MIKNESDIAKIMDVPSVIEDLVDIKCDYIYSRFFIHAIPEDVEDMFWDYVKRNSKNKPLEMMVINQSFKGTYLTIE